MQAFLHRRYDNLIIYSIVCLALVGAMIAVILDQIWLSLIIPSVVIGGYIVLYNIRLLYGALFMTIPMSAELSLDGGLSTDVIGEPILWVATLITLLTVITRSLPAVIFSRISLFLILHLVWILICALFAHDPTVGGKYVLAKLWYILPMYLLPFYLISDRRDLRFLFKCFIAGVLAGAIYFFYQHFQSDLSFASRTNAGQPIWRNHVNYACTLILTLPLLWYLRRTSRHPDRWLYLCMGGLVLFFTYFAFARIAYISLIAAGIYYLILRWKLTRPVVILLLGVAVFSSAWLSYGHKYLDFAPDYERAITHNDFSSKISATTQGTDISTMERLHRWVAGGHMLVDHPITGVGPGNYYTSYQPYTVFSFETYVSDNPEKSGIHSHFLMVLVEQGIIGLFLWLGVIISALIALERLYHQRDGDRTILVLCGSLLAMILTINLVNDMIEVIKVGGLFFFVLFLLQSSLVKEDNSPTTHFL